jgi:putative nucleotidyltransferase with HDIG domain
MTREITDLLQSQDDEIDYVAGLIHDVGKIVMASAFPDHFNEIYHNRAEMTGDLLEWEREVLGVDHAELGAMYLRKQRLPEVFVEIVQCHHVPQQARVQRPDHRRRSRGRPVGAPHQDRRQRQQGRSGL